MTSEERERLAQWADSFRDMLEHLGVRASSDIETLQEIAAALREVDQVVAQAVTSERNERLAERAKHYADMAREGTNTEELCEILDSCAAALREPVGVPWAVVRELVEAGSLAVPSWTQQFERFNAACIAAESYFLPVGTAGSDMPFVPGQPQPANDVGAEMVQDVADGIERAADRGTLRSDIAAAINRHSYENKSDTPDFILADVAVAALEAFSKATVARGDWYAIQPATHTGAPSSDRTAETCARCGTATRGLCGECLTLCWPNGVPQPATPEVTREVAPEVATAPPTDLSPIDEELIQHWRQSCIGTVGARIHGDALAERLSNMRHARDTAIQYINTLEAENAEHRRHVATLMAREAELRAEVERLNQSAREYEHRVMTGRDEQHERLVAEVERMRGEVKEWKARYEAACADADRLRLARDNECNARQSATMRAEGAEAEVERMRPVVDAVDAYLYRNVRWAAVINALIAYRSAKEKA